MGSYFEEARLDRLLDEYPVGRAFLAGPARMSRDELRALQDRRFRQVVARGWEVPFHARRWRAAGLEPGDVRGLDDVGKLPPFSKQDLMESVREHPPFGDFHGTDRGPDRRADGSGGPGGPGAEGGNGGGRHAAVFHTTSGTTGDPQPIFYGAWDREVQNALLARAYRLHGLRDDDVVHSVYGFGMVNGGHYVREAILHFTGARLLTAGTGRDTPSVEQAALMRRFGVTALVGFADYLLRLSEASREQGIEPSVRLISGHLGAESRQALSEAWGGAEAFDWYGVADTGCIAAEGPARDGLHVFEDAHFVELLDPDSDSGRPAPDGEPGALCATVLFKDTVYPVIRFDTRDLTRILPPDPGSGIGFRRITGFEGRADAMVKLRGVNVYPHAVGAHLADQPALNGEFVCRLARREGRASLTVAAEVRPGVEPAPALAREVARHLRARLGVSVEVELVGAGETAPLTGIESRQKPVRLIDEGGA